MTEKDVLDFLRENPDFLQNNPQACDYLTPPAPMRKKGVVDFQSYMIERLKTDKNEVLNSTREIIENARSNMNNQQRIHKAVLRLLEAKSFNDFIQSITIDLSNLMDVDIAVLLIESNGEDIPHVPQPGIRILPEGTVDQWMGTKEVMLQSDISGIEAIYGGACPLVQSQILLKISISMDTPPAILACGSRDPNMFHDGQATDQVAFLARVIERCFQMWLDLPR
ncbi:MAG: DUF484 family protein [Alphaproteobacteria bacterium]|nr:DUF484 family protein [Alphaproteobacteria bacterium]